MAARRDRTPPYEIMRTAGRASASRGSGTSTPQPSEPTSEPASGGEEAAWWSWAGVGVPIILRVPRGVAILIALGLLALIVLAYQVGHARGWSAATARIAEELDVNPEAIHRMAPTGLRGSIEGEGPVPGNGTGVSDHGTPSGSRGDPRQPGLNYFIVASAPPDHAREMARFLAGHGVETVIGSPNNRGLAPVWVVNRGFTADELYDSEPYKQWQARLKELGRDWREHNNGRGNAFGDMYPAKYVGE